MVEARPPRGPDPHLKKLERVYEKTAEEFRQIFIAQAWPYLKDYIDSGIRDEATLVAIAISLMTGWPQARTRLKREWFEAILSDILYGFKLGAQRQYRAFGGDGDFELKDIGVLYRVEQRAENMVRKSLFLTLGGKLLDWMIRGVLNGLKPQDVILDTKPLAEVVHHVALLDGYNEGRTIVMDRSWKGGEMKKVWRHAGIDKKRREHHQAIEGMKIGVNELFPVAGGVKHPHDWARAGCDEWCNCHCYVEYVPGKNAIVEPWNGS